MALNARQAAFVREYLVDGNATKAAVRAGYSERTAQEISSRLLSKAMIKEAIAAAQAKVEKRVIERTAITKADVIAMAMEGVKGAKEAGEWSAYKGNVDLVARLHGYIVDRKDMRIIKRVEDLTDDELAALETDIAARPEGASAMSASMRPAMRRARRGCCRAAAAYCVSRRRAAGSRTEGW